MGNGLSLDDSKLLSLDIAAVWRAQRAESFGFWALLIFVFVEYIKPQLAYPIIDVLPWGLLSMALALFAAVQLWGNRRWTLMDTLIVAFFVWVILTSLTARSTEAAFFNYTVWVGWLLMYFMLANLLDTPRRLVLFWIGFFLVNFKMSQHGARVWIERGFSFASWGATGSPGWFQNSGEFAMQMVGVLAMSWAFFEALRPFTTARRFRVYMVAFPLTALMSVMASSSRGGQLALAAVAVFILIYQRIRVRSILMSVIVATLTWTFLPAEQKQRFTTIGEDETSQSRLQHWSEAREVIRDNPLVGIGYENWIPFYAEHLAGTDARVEEIHNTSLQVAVELGIPGATIFLGMVLLCFRMNWQVRSRCRNREGWASVYHGMAIGLDLCMVGFIVAAQFMSVLFYPMFWMNFGLTAALSSVSSRMTTQRANHQGRLILRHHRGQKPTIHVPTARTAGGGA